MGLIHAAYAFAAVPFVVASLYLAALALTSLRRLPTPSPVAPGFRFDVIVPAHDEEAEIGDTVRSLRALDYPSSLYRIVVVADNCRDATAQQAKEAGAQVLVREDSSRRGKGYALAHAFAVCLGEGFADAFVVVDADTVVSSNLLRAFAARFAANAQVVQAEYGVRNPQSSWRTRLMTIALGAFHIVRSTAREHLQFSCGLRGNGMGFMTDVIRHHPPAAFSIVEDLEYGIQLGYAGIRIQYAHEASVKGLMAQTEAASRSQRRRWERGRQAIVRRHLGPILTRAWRSRDLRLFDLAVDLMVPPIGRLLTISVLGLLVSVGFGGLTVAFWLWCLGIGAIWLYVMMGWRASGVGWSGAFDLLYVPVYLVWKLTLRLRDRGVTPSDWVRTNREARL